MLAAIVSVTNLNKIHCYYRYQSESVYLGQFAAPEDRLKSIRYTVDTCGIAEGVCTRGISLDTPLAVLARWGDPSLQK